MFGYLGGELEGAKHIILDYSGNTHCRATYKMQEIAN
jgi:hypothetical protein